MTAFMIGALANGIPDPINMDQTQIDQVKQYLIDHKSQFRTFWKGDAEVKSLFKSGEIVISSGYPDTAKALQKEGVNAKFATAKEGQFLWACGYGITPERRPGEPRRRVRAAELVLEPRGRAVRGAALELPDREREGAGARVAGADPAGVARRAVPPGERDPREPAGEPGRVGRRVDRGEGELGLGEWRDGHRTSRSARPSRPSTPCRRPRSVRLRATAVDVVVAGLPRVRVPACCSARS